MELAEQIRVLIVEDDPDWRRGLSRYLAGESDMLIAAEAANGDEAVALAMEHDVDVVLMDVMMEDSAEGIRAAGEINRFCNARIIMLTSMQEKDIIIDAFKAGAVDYIVKSDFAAIPEAVRAAHRNKSPIHPDAAEAMREEFRRLKQFEQDVKIQQMKDRLTPTEIQVLELIEKGLSQTEIADQLVVSIRTVKIHVGHILRKMGDKSSKEAAKRAKDFGII